MTDTELAPLNEALAAAQGEFPTIPRDRTVTVETRTGGSYRFSYAPLDTILNTCRPVLAKHGLAVTQLLEQPNGGRPSIRTELRHKEGGVIGASFPLPNIPENPQQLGSLLTYLRRYAIVALLGIATEEDDDGGQAAEAPKRQTELRQKIVVGPEYGTAEPPQDVIRTEDPIGSSLEPSDSPFVPPPIREGAGERGAMLLTDPQRKKIFALANKLDKTGKPEYSMDAFKLSLGANYGTETIAELTRVQASAVIDWLMGEEAKLEL